MNKDISLAHLLLSRSGKNKKKNSPQMLRKHKKIYARKKLGEKGVVCTGQCRQVLNILD